MKARFLDSSPSKDFFTNQYDIQQKILKNEGFSITKDSQIPSTQIHSNLLRFQLYRTNRALTIIISFFFFVLFGIISQKLLENDSKSINIDKPLPKIPTSSGLKIVESEEDPFEYLEREIENIYKEDEFSDSDLTIFLYESNFMRNDLKEISMFDKKFSNDYNEYIEMKESFHLKIDSNIEGVLSEFIECSEALTLEKELLNILKREIYHNFTKIQNKAKDLVQIEGIKKKLH